MRAQEIDILIKKYLDAETTLAEETILRDYFNNNDVEEHLKCYKLMFAYFETKETYQKPIAKKSFGWIRVAASIVLLIGMYFGGEGYYSHQQQQAMEDARYGFNLLSANFDKGAEGMAYLGEFNKATNKIIKK